MTGQGFVATASIVSLVVLCAFFLWAIAHYGALFYREATGPRKLSTLAGAAAVIAIIINFLVGTFTQPLPKLAPPPKATARPAAPLQQLPAP